MSDNIGTLETPSQQIDRKKISTLDSRNILGVQVRAYSRSEAFVEIEETIKTNGHRKLAFLNAHGANLAFVDSDYRKLLREFVVLADGIGIDLGSALLHGEKFPDNLNGTDFLPGLFQHLKTPAKIGLLGGEKGVAEQAAKALFETYQKHSFVAISNGYFDVSELPKILKTIENSELDILLVALGNPLQEQWIVNNCSSRHANVAIGVGAFFDFCSGHIPRAPALLLRLRMEWVYRLYIEPARMWRRYLLGNPLFVLRIVRQKLFGLPWGKGRDYNGK